MSELSIIEMEDVTSENMCNKKKHFYVRCHISQVSPALWIYPRV